MKSTTSAITTRRDRRAGRAGAILLALMFAALGLPVYLLGTKAPPPTGGTTSAIVRLPADTMSQEHARAEILARPNVRRAIDACRTEGCGAGPCCPATLKSVRDRLQVRLLTDKASDTSPTGVHIECTYDTDPTAAVAIANRLAEQFAESVRLRQKAEAGKAHRQAQQAVVKTRKKLTEAQGRLDRFLQECLQPVKTPAAADSDRSAAAGKPAGLKANPDRVALRRQLDHARQYRAQLLIDRTPLHPMVRATDVEISDLEKRLAAIPHELVPAPGNLAEELRQMTDPLPAPLGVIGPAREDIDTLEQPLGKFVPPARLSSPKSALRQPTNRPSPRSATAGPPSGGAIQPPPFVSQQRFDTFLARKRECDAARKDYRRALARQREAWRRRSNLPPVEVVAARGALRRPTSPRRPRLAIVSLMVALAGAAGISMVASGVWGNMTFTDAAGARAALSVPVLATVPGADRASTNSRRRRFVEGSVQVVCGLFLLAICAGVLLAVSQVITLF